MVKVRTEHTLDAQGRVDVETWLADFPIALSDSDREQLLKAVALLDYACKSAAIVCTDWGGQGNCVSYGLDISYVLAELHVGVDCLLAGMMYRAVREQRISIDKVREEFGDASAHLLEGVLKMAAIGDLRTYRDQPVLGQAESQQDNIRQMLVSIVDDVRVALIKLAERTLAIRAVKNDPEMREHVAQEVFDIYAPLAQRLGIGHLKWELEDLSFRYIYPDAYKKLARLLDEKRVERDGFIRRVTEQLEQLLRDGGVRDAQIDGRAKHIYSIWRKMQRKGIGFSQVYDVRAFRIIVPSVRDCYATLGLLHGLWRNIPNEFDDYIANPKENGYRSLHTAVIGPEGKIIELQIRTENMHEEAELGVCAHWRYKGTDSGHALGNSYEEKIAWLRQVLDFHEETGITGDMAEHFSLNVAQDRVYVFTPQGDVVNLAHGATPLDFAYHVHTEVGHTCRGAKVNGVIVPLTYNLKTSDRVEVLTSKNGHPKRDWLQQESGYLKTSRARAKVQQWFKSQDREVNIDAGRRYLEREFKRLDLTSIDYQRVARKLGVQSVDEMYAAAGAGEITAEQVMNATQSLLQKDQGVPLVPHLRPSSHSGASSHVQVMGVDNLLTHMAGCCKPVPGDDIAGFITQSRGVSVHRADCARIADLQQDQINRIVEVQWSEEQRDTYDVTLLLEAYDRQGLLRDVGTLFTAMHVNVLSMNSQSNKKDYSVRMEVELEVASLAVLSRLIDRLGQLPNIHTVKRVAQGHG